MNKYNLIDILSKDIFIVEQDSLTPYKFAGIQIPMIQRDYAQGRIEESEIRNRFLKSIFHALVNKESLELDFVYGSIKELAEEKYFIPLDGQQRLTTLFLLHWYIGKRELNEEELKQLLSNLEGFSYATRSTARDFCERLMKASISFTKDPKKEITNSAWFYSRFEKDPTVQAMLIMLDAIHFFYETELVKNKNIQLFSSLSTLSFYILPLGGFNLSDELYIKMNARGKQLTDFENLKADLINWMSNEKNNQHASFTQQVDNQNRKIQYYLSISQKLDNDWTNYFWQFTKGLENKLVDLLYMRFIYRFFLNSYILKSGIDNQFMDRDGNFKYFAEESKYQHFDFFDNILDFSEIELLEKTLDTLSSNWNSIEAAIQPSWFSQDEKFSFLNLKFTQSERVVFLGICLYISKFPFDEKTFKQWMRIVWNIVENTDIADFSSAIGVMKLIEELSEYANDIYKFLINNPVLKSQSSKVARDEEIWKCSFINLNIDWEKAFIKAEMHKFFRGSISFIMTDGMTIQEFEHRTKLAEKVFDSKGVNDEYQQNDHLFLRALISKFNHYDQILWQNFTDVDEKEHYLKKWLASNEVVKNAMREWFSLLDLRVVNQALDEAINQNSQMKANSIDESFISSIRKIHELLYKEKDFQSWMQTNKAIRFGKRDERLFISKPGSWYNWVLVEGYRNEIIDKLLKEPYKAECSTQCEVKGNKLPYYFGNSTIIVKRFIESDGSSFEFIYSFDNQFLKVGLKESELLTANYNHIEFTQEIEGDFGEVENGWFCRKKYDFQNEVQNIDSIDVFIGKIENDVFTLQNQDSLMFKLLKSFKK